MSDEPHSNLHNHLLKNIDNRHFNNQQQTIDDWFNLIKISDPNTHISILILMLNKNIAEHYYLLYLKISNIFEEKQMFDVCNFILQKGYQKNVFKKEILQDEMDKINEIYKTEYPSLDSKCSVRYKLSDHVIYRILHPKKLKLFGKEWFEKNKNVVFDSDKYYDEKDKFYFSNFEVMTINYINDYNKRKSWLIDKNEEFFEDKHKKTSLRYKAKTYNLKENEGIKEEVYTKRISPLKKLEDTGNEIKVMNNINEYKDNAFNHPSRKSENTISVLNEVEKMFDESVFEEKNSQKISIKNLPRESIKWKNYSNNTTEFYDFNIEDTDKEPSKKLPEVLSNVSTGKELEISRNTNSYLNIFPVKTNNVGKGFYSNKKKSFTNQPLSEKDLNKTYRSNTKISEDITKKEKLRPKSYQNQEYDEDSQENHTNKTLKKYNLYENKKLSEKNINTNLMCKNKKVNKLSEKKKSIESKKHVFDIEGDIKTGECITIGKFIYYIKENIADDIFLIKRMGTAGTEGITITTKDYCIQKIPSTKKFIDISFIKSCSNLIKLYPKTILNCKNTEGEYVVFENDSYITLKKIFLLFIREHGKIDGALLAYYYSKILRLILEFREMDIFIEDLTEENFLVNSRNEILLVNYNLVCLDGNKIGKKHYDVCEGFAECSNIEDFEYIAEYGNLDIELVERIENDLKGVNMNRLFLKQKMLNLENL